jgi:hypothetical protein
MHRYVHFIKDDKLGAMTNETILKAVLEFLSMGFATFNSKLL